MFGERLRVIRKEKGLTQSDLATLLNVSPSTIGMYEQGRRNPDTQTVISLAQHFDVTTDWLLGISDIRNPYENKKDMSDETYLSINNFNLSKEDKIKVEEYIEFLKQKSNSHK